MVNPDDSQIYLSHFSYTQEKMSSLLVHQPQPQAHIFSSHRQLFWSSLEWPSSKTQIQHKYCGWFSYRALSPISTGLMCACQPCCRASATSSAYFNFFLSNASSTAVLNLPQPVRTIKRLLFTGPLLREVQNNDLLFTMSLDVTHCFLFCFCFRKSTLSFKKKGLILPKCKYNAGYTNQGSVA